VRSLWSRGLEKSSPFLFSLTIKEKCDYYSSMSDKPTSFRLTSVQQAAIGAAYLMPRTAAVFVIIKWLVKCVFGLGLLILCLYLVSRPVEHPRDNERPAHQTYQGMIDCHTDPAACKANEERN